MSDEEGVLIQVTPKQKGIIMQVIAVIITICIIFALGYALYLQTQHNDIVYKLNECSYKLNKFENPQEGKFNYKIREDKENNTKRI